jgi:hypothetical protein
MPSGGVSACLRLGGAPTCLNPRFVCEFVHVCVRGQRKLIVAGLVREAAQGSEDDSSLPAEGDVTSIVEHP